MTFATEEAGQILSQDARGRVLVSRERRASLLEVKFQQRYVKSHTVFYKTR